MTAPIHRIARALTELVAAIPSARCVTVNVNPEFRPMVTIQLASNEDVRALADLVGAKATAHNFESVHWLATELRTDGCDIRAFGPHTKQQPFALDEKVIESALAVAEAVSP